MSPPVTALVEELRTDARLAAEVVHSAYLPPAESRWGELDPPLPGALTRALAAAGAPRLWSHQAEGIAAVRRGEDLLITTPTASGKSLIFQVPVLEEALRQGPGRALFLFPLKALGQDQRGKLVHLAQAAGLSPQAAGCEIYDGDTPRPVRERIREELPRVLVTNPDMLHLGLLGYLEGWTRFFADLRWVVLDELHTYRGIFGSHFHHVLQRLLRACRREGAEPVFIASSATALNAGEFAERLAGRPFHWIQESGAPREGRHLVLLRPAASPYTTALRLFIHLLRAGLKTIVFTKARRITELLYSWLRRGEPELARRVASYRSGFLVEERREIEGRLFAGELDGVISTSALEMGIDVGGLDACILVGYPGSMMATWQRSGRVGRSDRESLTALVAMPDALDQYFLDHPAEFLERPCERLVVDPGNEPVTRAHLVCAAAEMPLSRRRDHAYLAPHAALVAELLREVQLVEAADGSEIFAPRRHPHRKVGLRGTGETFTILHAGSGRTVGTIDGVRVLHECHPGAVYLHAGRQYLVRELDLAGRKAHAEPLPLDYFTTPLTEKETAIREVLAEAAAPPLAGRLGRLMVTERVVGYERKRLGSQELLGAHPLDLPPVHFETVGLWWEVPRACEEALRLAGEHFLGALHAAEHAAISLFPLLALCDRGDIGGISYPQHPQVGEGEGGLGAVFIYDGHPGGIGIAARGFEDLAGLLGRVLDLINRCPCEEGCPSCIQSPKCGNGNRPLDKAGAARLLRLLLGREELSPEALAAAAGPRAAAPRSPRRPQLVPEPAVEAAAELVGNGGGGAAPAAPEALDGEAAEESEALGGGAMLGEEPGAGVVLTLPLELPARAARRPGRRVVPLPRDPENTLLFDLETRRSAAEVGGWRNAHRMGLAVGVVCWMEEGRFEVFGEGEVKELVARLRAADVVVGFNVRRFDYRVLAGYTGEDYNRLLPTLDLLEEVQRRLGFRVGLGSLAQETLGTPKSADGLQSLEWVRQGRLDLVADYCRRDVEILRDLYLFGRRECCLFYRDREDRRFRLPVEW
jgi:DEAD/DEAH box helicase domain-containing protein